LDTFLQSKTNRRTDRYGGSIENRYRFLDEVVQAVAKVWPTNRIAVRISPNGMFNDMGSTDYREQFTFVASQLDRHELAYLHVMDGLAFGFHSLGQPMTLSDFRSCYRGPLMGNCGYGQADGELAIANGHADMIAYGRPFISNPDLVERFKNGWPIAEPAAMSDWYSPIGAQGYTTFPTHSTE
jgi:2,4-dienoyl-CoA reductase-like NADH-dependent reductase (Old Yellow Enzyme family)